MRRYSNLKLWQLARVLAWRLVEGEREPGSTTRRLGSLVRHARARHRLTIAERIRLRRWVWRWIELWREA